MNRDIILKLLNRFFNINSKFGTQNQGRKLILSSSSLHVKNIFGETINKEISREIENTKSLLFQIDESIPGNLQIIQSQNFLNKEFHLTNIKIVKHFTEDGTFAKKFKLLLKLLKDSFSNKSYQTIICCNDSSLDLIKSQFINKKIEAAIIDDCK
jgi:hypothetical protein